MELKRDLPDMWFEIPIEIRFSHDFVSLSDGTVNKMRNGRIWLEYKSLRQYLMLFNESIKHLKDACYLLAIDTRKIGVKAINMNDQDVLRLVIKFFNSYLRVCLNAGDIRTTYNILHQYRQLAEWLMIQGNTDKTSGKRVVEISSYFRYYCNVALEKDMVFVAETAAFDVCTLCELAYDLRHHTHLDLLNMMLTIDDLIDRFSEDGQDKANVHVRGIRRAQVKLATTYLLDQRSDLAREIYHDMKGESKEMLTRIWQELECTTSKEFWEINDRGVNFEYLPPEKKAMLPIFFGWFGVSKDQGFNPNEWKHVSKFLHRAATKPEVIDASVDWKKKGLEKKASSKVLVRAESAPHNSRAGVGSKLRVETKMKTAVSPVSKASAAHSSLIGGRTAAPLGKRKNSVAGEESMAFILGRTHREVAEGDADAHADGGSGSGRGDGGITEAALTSSSHMMSLDFGEIKELMGHHSNLDAQVTSAASASTSGGVKKKFSGDTRVEISREKATGSKKQKNKGPVAKAKEGAKSDLHKTGSATGSTTFKPHLRLLNMRESSLMRSGSVSKFVDSRLRRHSRSDDSLRQTARMAAIEIAADVGTNTRNSLPISVHSKNRRTSHVGAHLNQNRRTSSAVLVKHTKKRRHSRRASTLLAVHGMVSHGRRGKRRSIDLIHRHHAMSSPAERPSPQQRGRVRKIQSKATGALAQKHAEGRAVQKKQSRAIQKKESQQQKTKEDLARGSAPTAKNAAVAAAEVAKANEFERGRQKSGLGTKGVAEGKDDDDSDGEDIIGGGEGNSSSNSGIDDESEGEEGQSEDMWVFSMYLIPAIFFVLLAVTLVLDNALFPTTANLPNYGVSLLNPTLEDARSSISLVRFVE